MAVLNDLLSQVGGWLGGVLRALLGADLATIVFLVISAGVILTFLAACITLAIWAERKVIARIQDRVGPNRVGPFGLLQSVADVLKLFAKEDTIPGGADRLVFILAPLLAVVPSLMIYAVLPWNWDAVVARLDVGILYVLALATFPTLAILVAGWASYNKYTLLGGMRAAVQLISYEVPEVLAVLPVVVLAGSLSLWDIAAAQRAVWFILAPVVGPLAFLVFFIAGLAEINRSPFDLVEAESEIIAGFHMEYSGMRWALFFLAEYANAFTVSAIASVLFFGGWHGPLLPGYLWVVLKTALLFVVMVWIRGTLPRLRYDQLLALAWKGLLPVALVSLVLAVAVRELGAMSWHPLLLLGINLGVVYLLFRWYTDLWRAAQYRAAAPLLEAAMQGVRS
ncbi:MAG TPA: NADH-quinone oxidoreductase subunit NuoH [Chloroflexota bacterium]|jgi:NADH-quinone oxidoreductase subunit H|nr:NADH-quinone oxidoreductase subunit NuoH [Chloroflexota bacterium]